MQRYIFTMELDTANPIGIENHRDVFKKEVKLDVLINDERAGVRDAVAKQGYGLDVLVNDEYWGVKNTVAELGYKLNELVNDRNFSVRKTAVIELGKRLIKHKPEIARELARKIHEEKYGAIED